jgi:hypothetical protein
MCSSEGLLPLLILLEDRREDKWPDREKKP